jgi:hypothetical protein
MIITPLDLMRESYFRALRKAPDRAAPGPYRASRLQKRILEEGLRAHWRSPIRRACGFRDPDFSTTKNILGDFYDVTQDIDRLNARCSGAQEENRAARQRLNSPRAALSRALRRLISRGLVEPVGEAPGVLYGHKWRLSTIGVKAARRLCPEVTPPAKAQIKRELKQIDAKRKALALGEHRIALQS